MTTTQTFSVGFLESNSRVCENSVAPPDFPLWTYVQIQYHILISTSIAINHLNLQYYNA